MLCCVVLCCVVLCCVVLCCVVLCCVVLCCVVLCCVVLCCVVLCCVVLCCVVLCFVGAGLVGAGWCVLVGWSWVGRWLVVGLSVCRLLVVVGVVAYDCDLNATVFPQVSVTPELGPKHNFQIELGKRKKS